MVNYYHVVRFERILRIPVLGIQTRNINTRRIRPSLVTRSEDALCRPRAKYCFYCVWSSFACYSCRDPRVARDGFEDCDPANISQNARTIDRVSRCEHRGPVASTYAACRRRKGGAGGAWSRGERKAGYETGSSTWRCRGEQLQANRGVWEPPWR